MARRAGDPAAPANGMEYPAPKAESSLHSLEDLKRIEKELFQEVIAAREQYTTEVRRYKDLLALVKELGMPHPESDGSIKSAMELQKKSLRRYSQAVRVFNDFILYKKMPPPKTMTAGSGEE